MKKILLFTILILSNLGYSMQQVGLNQASQALAAIAPQLMQTTRQISLLNKNSKNDLIKKVTNKWGNQVLDEKMRHELYKKYPKIGYIPPIYHSEAKNISALHIDLRKSNPITSSILKEAYPEKFITYNPKNLEEGTLFSLLHEIGHSKYKPTILAYYVKNGIRLSFIITIFFKMIAIKYGILGYVVAPRLFWNMYLRFFEEPYADDFAIQHANIAELKGGKKFFEKHHEKIKTIKIIMPFLDQQHPRIKSRINKIQRAIDGHPNYNRIVRIAILFIITEETIRLIYNYSTDEISIKDGLTKIEEIENNFESYCDKLEIPADGRHIYKNALEFAKNYFLQKLYLIQLNKADNNEEKMIQDEEIIAAMNASIEEPEIKKRWQHLFNPSKLINIPTETEIVIEEPALKKRWKPLFPEYQ